MTQPVVGRHLAALVVPFTASLEIDDRALRAVCREMLAIEGIDGIVVNAHAGEVDTLTAEERVHVLEIAAAEAKAHGKKIVGGVLPQPASYRVAQAMARDAEAAGADSLLLLGPAGFGRGVDLVPEVAAEYTRAVASAVSIPIIYFTAGALSGINYTPEVVKQICSVDGVAAVKDTMWSPQGFEASRKAILSLGRDVAVLSGNDNCLLPTFVSGADGTLLILHCVMAEAIIAMYDAVAANDLHAARAISDRYDHLVTLLFQRPMLKMPARFKYLMHLKGVIPNDLTRPPVPALSAAEGSALAAAAREVGYLRGANAFV